MTQIGYQIANCLESKNWIFAKTMPENPHWYTLRKEWEDNRLFDAVVRFIRDYGYQEKFKRSWYTMMNFNGYKYWTMGAPINQTILINRKPVDYQSDYDAIADRYDALFDNPADIEENHRIIEGIDFSGRVLDIGCGSGVLLDTVDIQDYTGIDSSKGMLDRLLEKHPDKQGRVIHAPFEDFYGKQFDTIVSLYGAISYVQPAALAKIKDMLAKGGQLHLMFYADGYTPRVHELTGIHPAIYGNNLAGDVIGNYKIVRAL